MPTSAGFLSSRRMHCKVWRHTVRAYNIIRRCLFAQDSVLIFRVLLENSHLSFANLSFVFQLYSVKLGHIALDILKNRLVMLTRPLQLDS